MVDGSPLRYALYLAVVRWSINAVIGKYLAHLNALNIRINILTLWHGKRVATIRIAAIVYIALVHRIMECE